MGTLTLEKLIKDAENRSQHIYEVIKEIEAREQGISIKMLMEKMGQHLKVMKDALVQGTTTHITSLSGITGGEGFRLWNKAQESLSGDVIAKAAARAMAVANVNASMGKIVAAPTAGSCGIIPGVIITLAEKLSSTDDDLINALFTAGAVGKITALTATLAGAEGGCQAECGSATAMAAAAAVEMSGGSPRQVGHAVAIALKCVMGLVCDPVAGLVEVPCIKRNGMGTAHAILAADMAMSGIQSVIQPDEVIKAMGEVGRAIPEQLKETSLGGIATTPTGEKIRKEIFGG